LSPHLEVEIEAKAILDEFGLADRAVTLVARSGRLGDGRSLAGQAWDLVELDKQYQQFIAEIDRYDSSDADPFCRQILLVNARRRLLLLSGDPGLPWKILPDRWIGHSAARNFLARYNAQQGRADDIWRNMVRESNL
jgi:phenylacetic acid degradation operon negative regulatory protein